MACRRHLAIVLSACLLANALAVPADFARRRRGYDDNELDSSSETALSTSGVSLSPGPSVVPTSPPTSSNSVRAVEIDSFEDDDDDDDDDDFGEPMQTSPTTGSNIFSLLRLAGALFPGSNSANSLVSQMIREILGYNPGLGFNHGNHGFLRRQDIGDNEIDIDYIQDLKPPPFQRQETEETSSSESDEDSNGDNDSNGNGEANNAAEESLENGNNNGEEKASEQDSNGSDDYDSDEPPEGDGGGILGILAGLSGGEDGQSDLGSLLATVSGIVANLSGDGFDLNALIASGLGLFVGLLSEGEENPGAVIASYLLTSLDTITGGGAKNNGAFFGSLVSKLVKGTSAGGDPDASSEEGEGMKMADSAGFVLSLIMSLLGDMSKGSSGGSSAWRRHEHSLAF